MVVLVKIWRIIIAMKRSLLIIGATCSIAVVPAYAQAVTPSLIPLVTATTPTTSTPSPSIEKTEREAAHGTYEQSVEQAENGRDLAFADANAILLQSLATAGKDRAARKAAHEVYKTSAIAIVTAYKKSIIEARQAYKTVLASLKEK